MTDSRTRLLALAVVAAGCLATVHGGWDRVAIAQQRTPQEYATFLEGAERVARMQVPRVVEALGLKPGLTVADIGSGSGLFTRPIATRVAPGTVYAVDIDGALLEIVERSARQAGLGNIRTVLGAADSPKLPAPVDLVFICDTLHHIGNQGAYLKTLRAFVAPGGRVAVIDFRDKWPEGHESMRYSTAQFDTWVQEAGFSRIASHDWLENSFFAIYR